MHVEGVVEFENSIPVDNSCLSKQYPVNIGGVNGIFETPILGKPSKESDFGSRLERPLASKISIANDTRWGVHTSLFEVDFSFLRSASVYFEIDDQNIDTIKDHLFAELMLWVRYLVENLCVLTGFDLIPPKIQTSAKMIDSDLNKYNLSYVKDKKTIKLSSPFFSGGFSTGYSFGCSLNDFETAVGLASNHKSPTLEYYLLLDSHRAVNDRNYRKAILDASSALEVCFTNLIDDHLSEDNNVKKEILRVYNSLRMKRQLLKSMDIQLPRPDKEYQSSIEDVRNRAIHGGYHPSKDEANAAYSITKDSLDALIDNKFE